MEYFVKMDSYNPIRNFSRGGKGQMWIGEARGAFYGRTISSMAINAALVFAMTAGLIVITVSFTYARLALVIAMAIAIVTTIVILAIVFQLTRKYLSWPYEYAFDLSEITEVERDKERITIRWIEGFFLSNEPTILDMISEEDAMRLEEELYSKTGLRDKKEEAKDIPGGWNPLSAARPATDGGASPANG